jgi:hypothetical protein
MFEDYCSTMQTVSRLLSTTIERFTQKSLGSLPLFPALGYLSLCLPLNRILSESKYVIDQQTDQLYDKGEV